MIPRNLAWWPGQKRPPLVVPPQPHRQGRGLRLGAADALCRLSGVLLGPSSLACCKGISPARTAVQLSREIRLEARARRAARFV
jgi:hypothetical protein